MHLWWSYFAIIVLMYSIYFCQNASMLGVQTCLTLVSFYYYIGEVMDRSNFFWVMHTKITNHMYEWPRHIEVWWEEIALKLHIHMGRLRLKFSKKKITPSLQILFNNREDFAWVHTYQLCLCRLSSWGPPRTKFYNFLKIETDISTFSKDLDR